MALLLPLLKEVALRLFRRLWLLTELLNMKLMIDQQEEGTKAPPHTTAFRMWLLGCLVLMLPLGASAQSSQLDFPWISASKPAFVDPLPERPLSLLETTTDTSQLQLKKQPQRLTVFGYYRLFLYGRNMTEPYPNLAPFERAYGVGDGYREPMLSLNVLGSPNGRSSFGSELFFFTPYLGTGTVDNVFSVNLGINFYGNFRTEIGKFGVRAGGIHWYNLSPFTIGVYQVLDRFSIFDRTPWEGVTNTDKYDSYFQTGSINRGDLRWNNQAFQGLILDGTNLPLNTAFDLFWGKLQPNGGLPGALDDPNATIQNPDDAGNVPSYIGFAGDRQNLRSFITGGRLRKTFGKDRNQISYNLLHSQTDLDTLAREQLSYQVHTLSGDVLIGKLNITGELGFSQFQSPITEQLTGEALMLRFMSPKEYTGIPLDVQIYQISPNFFNQNGEINTSANPEIQKNFPVGLVPGQAAVGGQITQVNQLQHNRRGINVNTNYQFGPLRLALGWGIAGELEPISSELSFIHRVNGLALSRIYTPFPANATAATVFGPYNRQISFFRGVFERVSTTDVNPATAAAQNLKYYNAIDIQAKLKTRLNERPLYLFYLGTLGSAKSTLTAIPSLDENAYLFVQYHEFDLYYEVLPRFILTGYLGLERALGGRFTAWGENLLPRDQTGLGIGGGFDWTVTDATGLYFRYRWMQFEDANFELDRYKGHEITIELKTFF